MSGDIEATIARLRELEAKATPGPWIACIAADDDNDPTSFITSWIESPEHFGFCGSDMNEVVRNDGVPGVSTHDNALFICEARNSIPAILAEIERLRALVAIR